MDTEILSLSMPGRPEPVPVNRYLIAKGEEKSVVLYWYQGRGRAIASEYYARAYVIANPITQNRTDTSLVRIMVPVVGGDAEAATDTAIDFVVSSYPHLSQSPPD